MATYSAHAFTTDSSLLFPGTYQLAFTVVETLPHRFTIQYDLTGQRVSYNSDASNLTYVGNTPTGGTFDSIVQRSASLDVEGVLDDVASTSVTLFNDANLEALLLSGNDTLTGSLMGTFGENDLYGGGGKDIFSGGDGADDFEFRFASDSRKGAAHRDVILDFSRSENDRIDLSEFDAKRNVPGDQHFKFIGKQDFHDRPGELHYVKHKNFLLVEGDTNGDGRADFQIQVNGIGKLTADDFILIAS